MLQQVSNSGRTLNRILQSLLFFAAVLFIATSSFGGRQKESVDNDAASNEDVIQSVSSESIAVGGNTYRFDKNVEVDKKGFKFTVDDLRPGWKVELSEYDEKVYKVKVVGIPAVITYPPYSGLKITVGVGKVRMGSLSNELLQSSIDLQSAIESMILGELQATNRFIVIDIRSRDELLNETDFSQSDYANPEQSTKMGRQVSADYIVRGHVLSFGMEQKKSGGFGAFGVKIGSKGTKLQIKMELSFEDVATGTTVKSFTDELKFESKGSAVSVSAAGLASSLSSFTSDLGKLSTLQKVAGSGLQVASDSYYESPIGEVCGVITNRLVEQLAKNVGTIPWHSVIVNSANNKFVIRGGADVGLKPGTTLQVFKSSDELVDPETGLSLGQVSAPIGVIIVQEVKEKVSICSYQGEGRPSRGDKCLLVSDGLRGQL